MILIDNRQDKIEVTDSFINTIENVIEYVLKEEKVEVPCEISIVFIDNEEIRKINKKQREIDNVTDVLSFPMLDYPKDRVYKDTYKSSDFDDSYFDEGNLVLGDIAISLERALEQSKEYGHTFLREASYLIVHSTLHLLGYDHIEEYEKSIMRKREEEILEKFSLLR